MAKSMALNAAAGLSGMLKEGHEHLEDGAAWRNIEAAKELSRMVSTSLGPQGMNKLVVNHLEKIIVTSDCATLVKELEVVHPAAKMLQLAAEMQDKECGDGTNLTVSFAGELLTRAEDLLRMGLHTSDIISGYQQAGAYLVEHLPQMVCGQVEDLRSLSELQRAVEPVLAAKHYGSQAVLAPLVAEACLGVMPLEGPAAVSPESVRVVKILGGTVAQSRVVHGWVQVRSVETRVTSVTDARITVFGCGLEASSTEASGTVLLKTAEELVGYNKSEEAKMEEIIKSIADSGTNVVVSGGNVSEMALHFMDRYEIMCIRIGSKWELRRLCAAVNATALVRLGPATPDEIGQCDSVKVEEWGGKRVTVFAQSSNDKARLSTIVLRASTHSLLQDLERAVDDGVHAVKVLCSKGPPQFVPGAGATEMALAHQIQAWAPDTFGLDPYARTAFGKALEWVPRQLAENAGHDASHVLAQLAAAHADGNTKAGVDTEANAGVAMETPVLDILATKLSAFRLAIDAAITVLRVDQIIMSKQAKGSGKK